MIAQRYIKFVIYTLHSCILSHPSTCIYATLSCLLLSVCPYSHLPAHPPHCRLSSCAHRSPLHIHCHYRVCCRGHIRSAAVALTALHIHCHYHACHRPRTYIHHYHACHRPRTSTATIVPVIVPAHIYTTIMPVIVPAHPPPLSCLSSSPHIHRHYRVVYVRGYRDSVLRTLMGVVVHASARRYLYSPVHLSEARMCREARMRRVDEDLWVMRDMRANEGGATTKKSCRKPDSFSFI